MIEYINSETSFGQKIKHLRTMRKMKQLELADGICSVSYLSKVENDTITPSEEIKELLLKRLNINGGTVDFDAEFYKKLNEWQQAISDEDTETADNVYNELLSLSGPFIKQDLQIQFKVTTIKYLVTKREFKQAETIAEELKELEVNFSLEIRYFYQRYVGELYYYQLDFKNAYQYLSESERLLPAQIIEKSERAQLYYSLCFSTCKTDQFHASINYGKKALELYQSIYNLNRCVECHVLLGIAYSKIFNFHESVEQYKKAKKLADSINFSVMLYTINHNIGEMYSFLGESEKAIKYYIELFNSENVEEEHQIGTIIAIIEEYYKLGKYDEVKSWTTKGLKLANTYSNPEINYTSVFKLYEDLCEEKFDNFNEDLLKDIIPFFENQQKFIKLSELLKTIADYEYNNNRYKTAAMYHSLSRDYLMKSIKN